MSRLPSHEIGMFVDYTNWSEFAENGFKPFLNLVDNHGADPQIAVEAFAKYNQVVDQYGRGNVAHGSGFSIEDDGTPVFAYLDGSPLMGIFVRERDSYESSELGL